jgi:hypothetical protein
MADKKITQLPSLSFISGSTTGYYAGEVVLPIVHNSTTVKIEAQKFALYATQWSATTASNTFIGNQTVNGNVVITGKLTAQEMHTEITSASIIFESGSTLFGNTADDTHTFTGTINVNGKVVGNASLDFTSQSLNIATGSYNRLYDVTSSVHFTTASLNTQTGSQQLINVQNSTVTSSLNLATASLNFTTGALNIASGSYNRFYQVTASVHSTTASLNQATSSLNFASGALNIATGSYNRFYDMTSSVHFTTQSLNVQTGSQELINVQNSTVSSSLNFASASINFTTGALNSFTGSIISQTNTIATFTSSVNFATSSLNVQTGSQDLVNLRISSTTGSINTTTSSFDSVFLRISSVTGSMNTQSSSQNSVNYQNSIVTSSFRNEIGGIEAYTASLKSAIIVNGTNVRIIGELTASRIYTEFITSSVLFVTGSNIIGDQSTDKHEFTGSVNINDTLFIKGQAIGLGELNTQTGSQDLVNRRISSVTGSINTTTSSFNTEFSKIGSTTSSIHFTTASLNTQTGSQDLVNLGISTATGSLVGITNELMALTASMKGQAIVSSSTQVQNYDVFALNSNLYNGTGSLIGITNELMALTASMKAAAVVSSSQQISDYNTFAVTSSANTFYGTQTISGSLRVSAPIRTNIISGGLDVNGGITGSVKGNLDGVAAYATTIVVANSNTTTDTSLFPTFTTSPVLASYTSLFSHASSSFFYNGVTRRVHMEGFVVSGSNNIAEISGSLIVTGSSTITGSLNISGSITINSGSIAMPNRPAFRVVGTGSTDRVAQTTLSGSYASIDYNEGNYYNNSTGIFTAPLTGLYNVYYNGRCGSVNAQQQVIIYKNGATGTAQLMWEAPGNTGVAHFGVSGVFKLVAGDTLEAKVAVGSIQFDGNDTWGAAYIG